MDGKNQIPSNKNSLSGKVDSGQDQEGASPTKIVSEESDATARLVAELNETLNFAKAYKTIRRDASNSGLELQENLGAVLQKNLSRRLNSLVSVTSQDRETVITRTPSRSVVTSTPIDSANHSPEPP